MSIISDAIRANTANTVIKTLERMQKADPDAFRLLFLYSYVEITQEELADDPSIMCTIHEDGKIYIGPLGVINGILKDLGAEQQIIMYINENVSPPEIQFKTSDLIEDNNGSPLSPDEMTLLGIIREQGSAHLDTLAQISFGEKDYLRTVLDKLCKRNLVVLKDNKYHYRSFLKKNQKGSK